MSTEMVPPGTLRRHPMHVGLFGRPKEAEYDLVLASVRERGAVLDPIDLTPADAEDHPSTIIDGHLRCDIAVDLGLPLVPVRVRPELRTAADQIAFAVAKAKRRQFTHAERAAQEEAVRAAIAAASDDWKAAHGYRAGREREMVALMTNTSATSVSRRKAVFFSEGSTPDLRSAVTDGILSLEHAAHLVAESNARYAAGSRAGHAFINRAVEQCRRARRLKRRGTQAHGACSVRHGARPDRAFWSRIHRELIDWALAWPADTARTMDRATVERLSGECTADIKWTIAEFRRQMARLSHGTAPAALSNGEINACLDALDLPPVRIGERVDMELVRRAHRRLSMRLHPDRNKQPDAAERFRAAQSAYERLRSLAPSR